MIKLSKKWSYALKAIIFIAQNNSSLVKIKDISISEKISETLLRRIIADAEKSELVKTVKWRNWWVKLWKELSKISVFDILKSAGEELWITECTKWESCSNLNNCSTTYLLWNLQKWFNSLLKINTLDKIVK